MANKYEFGLDILNDVLFRASEPTSGSDYINAAKAYIYKSYLEILGERKWLSAVANPPLTLTTYAEQTGTATCVEGSTSVTLDDTIATTMINRKFKMDDTGVVYRVSAHTAGTAAVTLDATYKEGDDLTGAFTIFQDEYDLSSTVLMVWGFWNRNDGRVIYPENSKHMAEHYGSRTVSTSDGDICRIGMIGNQRIRIYPWTVSAETLEYEYTAIPDEFDYTGSGSGDTPVLALSERALIADMALELVLFVKNDARLGTQALITKRTHGKIKDSEHSRTKTSHMSPRKGTGLGRTRH